MKMFLMSCPKCGSRAFRTQPYRDVWDNTPFLFRILCGKCYTFGPFRFTERAAMRAWNKHTKKTLKKKGKITCTNPPSKKLNA